MARDHTQSLKSLQNNTEERVTNQYNLRNVKLRWNPKEQYNVIVNPSKTYPNYFKFKPLQARVISYSTNLYTTDTI